MKSETWTYAGFVLVLLGGLFLRVRSLHESLWVDELHTAWTVSQQLADVAQRAHRGNQSPLYPWIVWGMTRTLGLSEVVLRLPSVVAGMTLIGVSGSIVWRWSESGALALLTSFLVAIDPHSVFFAQEARSYALVQLLALLQVACFARLALGEDDRISRCGWIGLTWVLFYLHYTSVLILLGEVVFGLLALGRGWTRREVRAWGIDLVIISAGLIPSVPHIQEIVARRDNWSRFIPPPKGMHLWTLFRMDAFLLVPSMVFGVLAAITWARGVRWTIENLVTRRILLLVCWLVVPLLVVWLTTRLEVLHLFFRRYLISVAVAPMVLAGLVGAALPGVPNRRGFTLFSAALAAALILPPGSIDIGGKPAWHSPENWRDAIRSINNRPTLAHLPVFVRSGLIEDDGLRGADVQRELIEFCLLPVESLYRLQRRTGEVEPLPSSRSWELSRQQVERLSVAGGAWFIVRGTPHYTDTLGRDLRKWLAARGIQARVKAEHFGNVSVVLLQLS